MSEHNLDEFVPTISAPTVSGALERLLTPGGIAGEVGVGGDDREVLMPLTVQSNNQILSAVNRLADCLDRTRRDVELAKAERASGLPGPKSPKPELGRKVLFPFERDLQRSEPNIADFLPRPICAGTTPAPVYPVVSLPIRTEPVVISAASVPVMSTGQFSFIPPPNVYSRGVGPLSLSGFWCCIRTFFHPGGERSRWC